MIRVPCRQKHHIIPFSRLPHITLTPVWLLDPTTLTGHPQPSMFCLNLNLQEWFSPMDIYPSEHVQGAAVTPLNLCFARLNVPVSLTSIRNKNPSDFFLQPCQTELISLGHLGQHLCAAALTHLYFYQKHHSGYISDLYWHNPSPLVTLPYTLIIPIFHERLWQRREGCQSGLHCNKTRVVWQTTTMAQHGFCNKSYSRWVYPLQTLAFPHLLRNL